MFGEPDVDRLWEVVEYCVRLDEDDPVAAWRAHVAADRRARTGAQRPAGRRAPVHGPGTDLTVGLLARVAVAGRASR